MINMVDKTKLFAYYDVRLGLYIHTIPKTHNKASNNLNMQKSK